jgi:hypothetical protein
MRCTEGRHFPQNSLFTRDSQNSPKQLQRLLLWQSASVGSGCGIAVVLQKGGKNVRHGNDPSHGQDLCVYVCVCVYVSVSLCLCVSACMCMCVCVCVCV